MKGVQGAIHFDVTGDETDLENALARSRSSLIASGRTAEQEGAKIEQMFKRAASGVLAFFTVSKATDFVKSMATVHGEFQSIQIALSTILGSEERAVRLFAQLKDTAVKTPFDMKSIAQGAKQLIAYGESADTVNDTLIKLGDISAGLSQPLGDLVYLYGTTMTQGRLYTQDLNQFTGRGIPMIRELADEFGVAESEVRGLVEAGRVGFPEVQKVINKLSGEGGMFFNLMQKMSESVTGKISNLADAWSNALDKMGQANEGFLYSGIEGATYLIEHYKTVLKITGMLVTAYGSYKAAIIATHALESAQKNFQYTAEIEELMKLLPQKQAATNADLQAAVASGKLTQAKANALASIRAEIASKLEELKTNQALAQSELVVATASHKSALQRALNSKSMVSQREMELSLAKLSGNAAQIEIAQKSLLEAQEERHIAVKARKATADSVAIAQSKVSATTTAVDTLQTRVNTAVTVSATKAKNIFALATMKVTTAFRAMKVAFASNPIGLLLTALTTVIAAMSMFSGCTDDSAESVDRLAESNKKASEEFEKESSRIKTLSEIVENSNVHYLRRQQCLEELKRIIPDYHAQLTKEGELINNNTDAIRDYIVQLEKEIRFKTFREDLESAIKAQTDAQKNYDKASEDHRNKSTNSAYYDDPIIDVASLFGQRDLQKSKKALSDAEAELRKADNAVDSIKKAIEETSTSTSEGTTKFKSFAEQVAEAKTNITTLTQELKDLRAGKGEGITNWSKAIEDKEKELKAAQDSYNTLLGIKPDKKDGSTKSTEDYKTKISNDGRELQRLYEDLELSIQKARIDAMDEGLDKVLMTNELNHKVEIAAIERQKEDTLRKIQDSERTIWESQNPDWKKKGLTFTPTTTELPENIVAQFDSLTKSANDRAILNNKNALDEMLADFATYAQRRDKIKEDFEKKRKSMYNEDGTTLKSGFTQGNVDELNRSEEETYKAVDEQFAMREETYQAWLNKIANMALDDLELALQEAKKALAEAEKSGVSGSKLAEAKAKVNTAEKKVKQVRADNEVSPGKRSIKEWEDLYKTLQEVEREFESIGDTVGGVAGEIISTAGQIATSSLSMINGIMQLTTTATTGATAAATASATAIQTVEKASIILTIISAAMQIAMTIINLFNNDKAYQKEIENLQERIDQLQWELDNEESVRLGKSIDILNTVRKTYSEVTTEVLKLHAAEIMRGNFLYRMIAPVTYQNEILQKSAENLAVAYANIQYTADKALGSAKYNEAEDKLRNIAQQQLLMQEQIRNEDAKKKTDHGKIADWERQIIELGEEANKIINEIVEDILGGSAADLAKDLGDAFIDAFQAGEDAAEAWGDKVDEIVANVIKQMLVSKYLEEPLGAIFDKYKSKWYKDGQFAGIDAIMESMNGFASDLNGVGDEFKVIWDNLPDSIKNLLPVSDDDSREASERGIATASQESVDENNGRLTAIQGHTYSLNENVKTLVVIGDKTLEATNAIRDNTAHCKRLENMEKDIKSIKTKLDDIDDSGIKIK